MNLHRESFRVETRPRGFHELTSHLQRAVREGGCRHGLATAFVHHTSASLVICENADPDVLTDLGAFAARWVRDGDPAFLHDAEGPDDMAAHVRSVFTQASISIPVTDGRADLGTWQGLFLWEHRTSPHVRRVTITILGEPSP